jgi:hypothetical protein
MPARKYRIQKKPQPPDKDKVITLILDVLLNQMGVQFKNGEFEPGLKMSITRPGWLSGSLDMFKDRSTYQASCAPEGLRMHATVQPTQRNTCYAGMEAYEACNWAEAKHFFAESIQSKAEPDTDPRPVLICAGEPSAEKDFAEDLHQVATRGLQLSEAELQKEAARTIMLLASTSHAARDHSTVRCMITKEHERWQEHERALEEEMREREQQREKERLRERAIEKAWQKGVECFPDWLAKQLDVPRQEVLWLLEGPVGTLIDDLIGLCPIGDGGLCHDSSVAHWVSLALYGYRSVPFTKFGAYRMREEDAERAEAILHFGWRGIYYLVAAIYNMYHTSCYHQNMNRITDQFDYIHLGSNFQSKVDVLDRPYYGANGSKAPAPL